MNSSDLWVAGSVSNVQETGKSAGVTYAIGAIQGAPLTAPVTRVARSSPCVQVLSNLPILTSQVMWSAIKPLVSHCPGLLSDLFLTPVGSPSNP